MFYLEIFASLLTWGKLLKERKNLLGQILSFKSSLREQILSFKSSPQFLKVLSPRGAIFCLEKLTPFAKWRQNRSGSYFVCKSCLPLQNGGKIVQVYKNVYWNSGDRVQREKTYLLTCAHNYDLNQPANLCILIRVIVVCMKKL